MENLNSLALTGIALFGLMLVVYGRVNSYLRATRCPLNRWGPHEMISEPGEPDLPYYLVCKNCGYPYHHGRYNFWDALLRRKD